MRIICRPRVLGTDMRCKLLVALQSTTLLPLKHNPLPHVLFSLFSLFSKNDEKLSPSFSNHSALLKKECLPKPFAIRLFPALLQNTPGCTLSAPLSIGSVRPFG